MKLHSGLNVIDGIPVEVERKRVRRINLRIDHDGRVRMSIPIWWSTLAEGAEFLSSKWKWVVASRAQLMAVAPVRREPPTADEIAALRLLLEELHSGWAARLGEAGVTWRIWAMKSLWGSCHFVERRVVYNAELARKPRELVEYVVVHELTHLRAHDHGPAFQALMDERLPGWRAFRARLKHGS